MELDRKTKDGVFETVAVIGFSWFVVWCFVFDLGFLFAWLVGFFIILGLEGMIYEEELGNI